MQRGGGRGQNVVETSGEPEGGSRAAAPACKSHVTVLQFHPLFLVAVVALVQPSIANAWYCGLVLVGCSAVTCRSFSLGLLHCFGFLLQNEVPCTASSEG